MLEIHRQFILLLFNLPSNWPSCALCRGNSREAEMEHGELIKLQRLPLRQLVVSVLGFHFTNLHAHTHAHEHTHTLTHSHMHRQM